MVHFYAAAAWEAQRKFSEAESELDTLLREDPKNPAAEQAHQMMAELKEEASRPAAPGLKLSFTQVAAPPRKAFATKFDGPVLRASADEVAVFFSATNHGKSVTNLTGKEVAIRDNSKAPAAITGFRNESDLPLRLGIVIDTSDSIATRFKFEQDAVTSFLNNVVTGPHDLAFVVGFANSVLLVQDFTSDPKLVSHAISQLVPSGGTALWDAVDFAADKLATQPEAQPVARILIVISDGKDNSSSVTARQAINCAQRGDVTIYTVSTRDTTATVRDLAEADSSASVGEHALRTLAELTGGASFVPGSVHRLNGSFSDLQQVIRSRYLISYKPALFNRDGQFRAINICAEKDGHKLHVYARKGYYASTTQMGNF